MKLFKTNSLWLMLPFIIVFAFAGCSDDSNDDSGSGMFTSDNENPASNSVYLELESHDNDTFVLAVKAKDLSNVYGIYFDVNFNGEIIEYVSATEGDFLKDGSDTFFLATGKANSVVIGVTRQTDAASKSGSGIICKITFRGLVDGTSRLDFSRNAVVDPSNNAVPGVTWVGGLATIVK
jgi:hypothetical protein